MDEAAAPAAHRGLSPGVLAVLGACAFAASGLLFVGIAWDVAGHGALVGLDARAAGWLHARRTPVLTAFMLAVTHLNSIFAICAWSAVLGAHFVRARRPAWVLALAIAVGGGLLVNLLLKHAFERARPRFEEPLVTLSTYSFPSGHTTAAALFYGVLAAYLASRTPLVSRRVAWALAAFAMVALVALTRVYLGAHYLSDVLAAACGATAWLILSLFLASGFRGLPSARGGGGARPRARRGGH